jgi:hypothetical protein
MGPPPTSVLLPTTEWTAVVTALADQLRPADELLVVCDDESDPVAGRVSEQTGPVRLVVAGEPSGCSGKANAVAAGIETASNDRLVWTDDDFRHPPNWLASLHEAYADHGPVGELPFFVGRDQLAVLLEPVYVLGGTMGTYVGDRAWGGAVMFERDDIDVGALKRDLRRTVSDDGLLSERLDVTALRSVRRVAVGGTLRETLERHVRFTHIVRRFDPGGLVAMVVVTALLATGAVLSPLYWAGATTALAGLGYGFFGLRRWTFLLAAPAILAEVPLLAYALARRTFVWGGRRYRWRDVFDVAVVG